MLAIRLHELSDVVDIFVIVQATRNFAGQTQPATLHLHHPAIAPFASRIRHIVVDDMPDDPPHVRPEDYAGDWNRQHPRTGFWRREKHQRNCIMRGLTDAQPHDMVLISDVDEIPRADLIRQLHTQPVRTWQLAHANYYFYANYRQTAGPEAYYPSTIVCPREQLHQHSPDHMRIGTRQGVVAATRLTDTGWHLSYLGLDDEGVRAKIRRNAHQEYNHAAFLDAIDIQALIHSGQDLYGRAGYTWSITPRDRAPAWLRNNPHLQHLFVPEPTK